MAADWKTQAKTEYEAELYRQTHPYEQWIADNEPEDMEDLPDGKSMKSLKVPNPRSGCDTPSSVRSATRISKKSRSEFEEFPMTATGSPKQSLGADEDGSVTQFRGETPDDFLVLTQYYFRGLLEGHAEDEMRKRSFGINADSRLEQESGDTADAVDRILEGVEFVLVVEFEPGLDPRAFAQIRHAFSEHPDAEILYADEDVIDAEGKRSHPWFKPDWSPDTFRSFKYFGHIVAYRATCIRKMVRDEQWDPAKCDPTEFAIRVSAGTPLHLPKVLFHNRCDDPLDKEDVYQKVWRESSYSYGNLNYPIELNGRQAKVSVIIPSKDQPGLLEQCLKGLRENTDYPDFEIIVVDNGSSEENRTAIEKLRDTYDFSYLYEKEEFNFSRMCNRGAAAATGDLLLFLNDDIEVLRFNFATKWMRKMAGQALLSHVGAVGAKLWYPWQEGEDKRMPPKNCRIQHCGITNIALGPVHKMGGMEDKGNIYHFRNRATYNILAVTAACLMVRREKFDAVGGFDEGLAVAYNDVDFCFSLYEKGWYNVVRADAVLIHHESASRGSDESPEKRRRREAELEKLYRKHPALYGKDPFYSPHLVQERLDVDYNLGYAYPYEKADVRSEITPLTAAEYSMGLQGRVWRKLGVDLQILQHIDDARRRVRFAPDGEKKEEYQIEGWAAPAKKAAYLFDRKLLLLADTGDGHEFSLFPKRREDTKEILAEQEAWELAGFVARIPAYSLADGEYRVLLSFVPKAGGRAFVMDSGTAVVLKNEEITLKRETV